MSDPFDDSSYTERFGPESPHEEAQPPQFSLWRLLVFVSVAALAAALYGERMRVDPPMRVSNHVMFLGMLPSLLLMALWQRKQSVARSSKTVYLLRQSYWPLSMHYRVTAVFWMSLTISLLAIFPFPFVRTALTIGFVLCLFVLGRLILESWWRVDLRDTLLCEDGIIWRGWLFTSWDQLQGFQLSSERPPSRVELSMRAPGIWPTNFCITLFLPEHDPQSVLEFLEQKAGEQTE